VEPTRALLPIAAEGWPFILTPAAFALVIYWLGWPKVALAMGLLALFMAYFFRDPERIPAQRAGVVLAPADGRVVEIREVTDAFVGRGTRVSIFLSPLDVHVNRAPIAGLVVGVEYRPGRFLPAYREEASDVNERATVHLQGQDLRVTVTQIAGILARRVVCRLKGGEKLQAGERFGMIRFGSRVDLVLPPGVRVGARVRDRVRAGESVIGVLP
jgi:phosphatidylserine decarboxylase